ncbi:DUF5325 family protein [Paenibacillus melissococcoides]|uniref:DUF5325 family protein n=1 Tax=Paenibacillus melissococcoides TaxID=2912268 RepID=A0ABM9FVF5_9BACL|nr:MULTISPECIES: DUF5325 family protein [Paenibacillus]MEB9894753.1 DUF5325 family protein [Bacillus cereus]CAH8243132.1 DUF5325 family protein [Paenibacillus melissococcoides]CAH8703813.1 DUF5325 family protein [Paenibacillus melissococcoides]CAH8706878.1 DUF5325 family protein [Paenibacillus melissococcoides]GIO77251.1 hypothetical protein J6TS7_08610 [Paenibacillus dendritiformis]
MSKGLALWFAVSSIVLLTATAITISHNIWLSILFAVLAVFNIGFGFIVKARQRRKSA